MHKLVEKTLVTILILIAIVAPASAQWNGQGTRPYGGATGGSPSSQPPSYNYQQHAYDSYRNSADTFSNNPTRHNYEVMQNRQQVYEMRTNQYNSNGWNNATPRSK